MRGSAGAAISPRRPRRSRPGSPSRGSAAERRAGWPAPRARSGRPRRGSPRPVCSSDSAISPALTEKRGLRSLVPSMRITTSIGRWLSRIAGRIVSPLRCGPSIGSSCSVVRPGWPSSITVQSPASAARHHAGPAFAADRNRPDRPALPSAWCRGCCCRHSTAACGSSDALPARRRRTGAPGRGAASDAPSGRAERHGVRGIPPSARGSPNAQHEMRLRPGRLDHRHGSGNARLPARVQMLGADAVEHLAARREVPADRPPAGRRRRSARPRRFRRAAPCPASRFMAGEPMKPATKTLAGPVVKLQRRADLRDTAVAHDDDAVGHGHRLDLVVGDIDGRRVQAAGAARGFPTASARAAWRRGSTAARRTGTPADRGRWRGPSPRAGAGRPTVRADSAPDRVSAPGYRLPGRRAGRSRPCPSAASSAESPCSRQPSCADRARSSGTPWRCRVRLAAGCSPRCRRWRWFRR